MGTIIGRIRTMESARCNCLHITKISFKIIRYVTHDVLSLADVTLFIYETSPIYQDEFRSTKTIHGDCSKGETRFDSVELSKRESNR